MYLECIVLLRITATSYENAYAIFESLNDRGLGLSQADLIKNELLRVSSSSERDDVIDSWSVIKQILADTKINLPELLHYSCLHRQGQSKAQSLFAFVKKLIGPSLGAKKFASEVEEDARAIEEMLVKRPSTWKPTTCQMIDDLVKVMAVKFAYPMLLASHRKFSKNAAMFDNSVRMITNFVFRYMKVGEGSPEKLAEISSEIGGIYMENKTDIEILKDVSNKFKSMSPDSEFEEDFKEYSESNTKQSYFSVFCIEKFLLNGTIPLPHGIESNLEHIMPKAPTKAHWPKALALKSSDPVLYAKLLWSIGNLLPLPESINKSIKNKDINYKMSGGTLNYSKSTLISPVNLGPYLNGTDWDEISIEKRQIYLATIAAQVWSLDP